MISLKYLYITLIISFFLSIIAFKIVIFFLGKTNQEDIKISHEHLGYQWLEFDEAYKLVAFDNSKKILKKANDFIKKNG
jgi:8-oxo-dGTP pyrophosphatase MutT (NUDIX family)